MNLNIQMLRDVTNRLFDHLSEEGVEEVALTADYYWNIEPEFRYDQYDEPKSFMMGQLTEDLQFLEQIARNERPPVTYGFVWASSLLRFVGEKVVK
jgi:hypothetical protein